MGLAAGGAVDVLRQPLNAEADPRRALVQTFIPRGCSGGGGLAAADFRRRPVGLNFLDGGFRGSKRGRGCIGGEDEETFYAAGVLVNIVALKSSHEQ